MRLQLTAALLLALGACASTPATDDLAAYPAALVGAYDNTAQYAQAPDDLKRPAVADGSGDWIDQQAVTFSTVAAPALGRAILYAEWRNSDGAISRQRLWVFRRTDSGVRIDLYSPKDPTRLARGFAALTLEDLTGYGPACALTVSASGRGAWNAQTDTETCRTASQDGRPMTIDARVTVMPTGVLYQEASRTDDGDYIFRLPGGAPYDFRRRP